MFNLADNTRAIGVSILLCACVFESGVTAGWNPGRWIRFPEATESRKAL